MKIKIKLSKAFEKYIRSCENESVILCFEKPVPVKKALKKLKIPEDLPKLILINGIVKNKDYMLKEGDTISIFPTMSGG